MSDATNQTSSETQSQAQRQSQSQTQPPKTISGRSVLLFSLVALGLGMPLATWGTYLWVSSRDMPPPSVSYAQKDTWRPAPVRVAALLKSGFLTPPRKDVYNHYELTLTQEQQDNAQPIAERLRQDDHNQAFSAQAVQQTLDQITQIDPQQRSWLLCYQKAILLQQLNQHGNIPSPDNTAQINDLFETACRRAPRVMQLRVIDADRQPIAGLNIGTLEIAFAQTRINEDAQATLADPEPSVLDENFRLVIPNATTDADGRLIFPVDQTPFQLVTRPTTTTTNTTENNNATTVVFNLQWFEDAWYTFPGKLGTWPEVLAIASNAN